MLIACSRDHGSAASVASQHEGPRFDPWVDGGHLCVWSLHVSPYTCVSFLHRPNTCRLGQLAPLNCLDEYEFVSTPDWWLVQGVPRPLPKSAGIGSSFTLTSNGSVCSCVRASICHCFESEWWGKLRPQPNPDIEGHHHSQHCTLSRAANQQLAFQVNISRLYSIRPLTIRRRLTYSSWSTASHIVLRNANSAS